MGEVLYAASPLQAFFKSNLTALILLGLGALGLIGAVLQRQQRAIGRVVMAGAGLFLIVVGGLMAVLSLRAARSGTQTLQVNLDSKRVVDQSCGDYGQTCKHYVLEIVTSAVAYDIEVPSSAYDRVKEGNCYRITYFPATGMFADASAQYQRIDTVARIETADPSGCE